VAVADVFDALTSNRPYKRAWSFQDALTTSRLKAASISTPPAYVRSNCASDAVATIMRDLKRFRIVIDA